MKRKGKEFEFVHAHRDALHRVARDGSAAGLKLARLLASSLYDGSRVRQASIVLAQVDCKRVLGVVCNFSDKRDGQRQKVVILLDLKVLADKIEHRQVERSDAIAIDENVLANKGEGRKVKRRERSAPQDVEEAADDGQAVHINRCYGDIVASYEVVCDLKASGCGCEEREGNGLQDGIVSIVGVAVNVEAAINVCQAASSNCGVLSRQNVDVVGPTAGRQISCSVQVATGGC